MAVELVLDPLARRWRPGGPGVRLSPHQRRLVAFQSAILEVDDELYNACLRGLQYMVNRPRKLGGVIDLCDRWEDFEQRRLDRLLRKPKHERNLNYRAVVRAACHWQALREMTLMVYLPGGGVRQLPRSREDLRRYSVEEKNVLGPALWGE